MLPASVCRTSCISRTHVEYLLHIDPSYLFRYEMVVRKSRFFFRSTQDKKIAQEEPRNADPTLEGHTDHDRQTCAQERAVSYRSPTQEVHTDHIHPANVCARRAAKNADLTLEIHIHITPVRYARKKELCRTDPTRKTLSGSCG